MRKAVYLVISVMIVTAATGCGKRERAENGNNAAEKTLVTASETEKREDLNNAGNDAPETARNDDGTEREQVSVADESVYAQAVDMVVNPEKYTGKTVTVTGEYAVYHDEETNRDTHACIVSGPEGETPQVIEFEPPADTGEGGLPEEKTAVSVTGEFSTYTEDGYTYCIIKNTELTVP